MRTETAERCIMECQRFIKAWQNCVIRHNKITAECSEERKQYLQKDFLDRNDDIGKDRAALRRASLDLSNALADLRQGR
jgi:hypothetical protein